MATELICIDLDGTLLDDQKRINKKDRDSLKKAADEGIKIALVSGRMLAAVTPLEKELGIECIKICNAGTTIFSGDRCIYSQYFPIDTMETVYYKFAEKNHIPIWIYSEKEWFVSDMDAYIEKEIKTIQYEPKVVNILDLFTEWKKNGKRANKLLFAASKEQIDEIYRDMKKNAIENVAMARSADIFLEIFPANINKGIAVKTICEKYEIDLKDVMAFGDQELDMPMIEMAGFGVAMGNAIPQLKKKADFITKTNNEAGIAYALEETLWR